MNAAVLNREFTRPASSRERGFAIANHPIPELESVFGPIREPDNPSPRYVTGDELTKNQIRLASFIGTLLRI
ncbi:MAG TPA: hypothetical protein VF020_00965 [Chthoniobacterales bacterium]